MREHYSYLTQINAFHRKRGRLYTFTPFIGTPPTTELLLGALERQQWLCVYCKGSIRSNYTLDHILSLSNGGKHVLENIQFTCPWCNLSKGGRRSAPRIIPKPVPLISYDHATQDDWKFLRRMKGLVDEREDDGSTWC